MMMMMMMMMMSRRRRKQRGGQSLFYLLWATSVATTTSTMMMTTTTSITTALMSSVVVIVVQSQEEPPPPPEEVPLTSSSSSSSSPLLYACGDYSSAQPFPFNVSSLSAVVVGEMSKNQTLNDDFVVDDAGDDDSSFPLVDVTVLVLDVSCAHDGDGDKNPDYSNPAVVPQQIHIHLYALMDEDNDEEDEQQEQEPRWNCFPPSLVRPVLNTNGGGDIILNDHETSTATASIPWLEINQTWYRPSSGLHFVYDNGSDDGGLPPAALAGTGACIELWMPLSLLEAVTVVGPAFDHVADIQVHCNVDNEKEEEVDEEQDGAAIKKGRAHRHLTVWNAGTGTQLLVNITSPTTTLALVDQSLEGTYQVLLLGNDDSGDDDDDDDNNNDKTNAIWTLGSNTQGLVMSDRDDLQLFLGGFQETLFFSGDFDTIAVSGSAIHLASTEDEDDKYSDMGGFCDQIDLTEAALAIERRGGRNSTCTIIGNGTTTVVDTMNVTTFPHPVPLTCLATITTTKALNCLVSEATTTMTMVSSRWRWYGSVFLGLLMGYMA